MCSVELRLKQLVRQRIKVVSIESVLPKSKLLCVVFLRVVMPYYPAGSRRGPCTAAGAGGSSR